jgi:hypothetical protein
MKTAIRLTFAALALLGAQRAFAQASSSSGSQAASSTPAPYSCTDDPERHRFDFWIGAWDVKTEDGTHVGDSIIESISNGCAVLENWTGAKGGTGKSLNSYNSRLKQWQQFWIGSDGDVHEYRESQSQGNSLAFFWKPAGSTQTTIRLTFTPVDKDTVRQHSELSSDGGKTWKTEYDFYYHRRS